MAGGDLLSIIKGKQAQIARLRAELEEAQALLAAIVRDANATPTRRRRQRQPRRRSYPEEVEPEGAASRGRLIPSG